MSSTPNPDRFDRLIASLEQLVDQLSDEDRATLHVVLALAGTSLRDDVTAFSADISFNSNRLNSLGGLAPRPGSLKAAFEGGQSFLMSIEDIFS